ncbi:MAG: penicillin acylase family protein [Bacteroidota bacterium]
MPSFQDILAPVLHFYLNRLARQNLPKGNSTIKANDLDGEVEMLIDKWGVAHIYADSMNDLCFAQGYFHAQSRLFQMEMGRRLASGTISEVVGPDALPVDRVIRTLGIRQAGLKDLEVIKSDPDLVPLYQRYTDGINHYITSFSKKLPIEFKMLRITPAPWSLEDSMALGKLIGFQMSYGWLTELEKQRIADTVGPDLAAELDIHYRKDNQVILPKGNQTYAYQDDGKLAAFNGPYLKPLGGSNNWSVSPGRTKDGAAYVCNDPHLPISLPSIWIENHLTCGDFEVTGVTIPGLPFVLVGHNKHIGWGTTLAFTDVQDSYIEEFVDTTCESYKFGNTTKKAEKRIEKIPVKGWKNPHEETVISTHHGPVISDVLGYPNKKIAIKSTALMPSKQILGFYKLNKARNWNEFVDAMSNIDSPGLNIVYGDTDNNIGYYVTGKVPIRPGNRHDYLPRDGSTGLDEWQGYVPFEEMPHAFNPPEGFVATCNNKIVGDDFPHDLGNLWMNGFRYKRLVDLFGDNNSLSADDFAKFQNDFHCLPGPELAAFYKDWQTKDTKESQAIEYLVNWDGNLTADSVGGCIYEVVKNEMLELVIGKKLGKTYLDRFKGVPPIPIALSLSAFFGHDTTALLRILNNGDSWWNTEAGGTQSILGDSLKKAIEWLTETLGNNVDEWHWGRLHTIAFHHSFSEKAPVGKILDAGEFAVPGNHDTLCQMSYIPDKPYGKHLIAPSYRQIINMQDFDASLNVLPPGQSANHLSPNYGDQIDPWLKGDYKPMLWSRDKIEGVTVRRTTFAT